MSVLNVEHLSFAYEKERVLEDISFSVQERDFLAVIGPNGGGKSTLLKLILGLLKPMKGGSVELLGETPDKAREKIGYVPQNTNINLEFPIKVLDVVMMGNKRQHTQKGKITAILFPTVYSEQERGCARNTLKQVGMEDYIDRKISDLSGGQRQRVMIARALCSHPELLVLDEPTSGIDIEGQRQIFNLLERLNESMTIIVVSHDLSLITKYANKALYIHRKGYFHDLGDRDFLPTDSDDHFCEIELMEMLGREE